jgi:hypothetical protein
MVMRGGNTVVELRITRNVLYWSGRPKLLIDSASIESVKKAISPAAQPGDEKIEFEEKVKAGR